MQDGHVELTHVPEVDHFEINETLGTADAG